MAVIWQQDGRDRNEGGTNLDWLGGSSETSEMAAERHQQQQNRWRKIELAEAGATGQQKQQWQHGTDSDGGGANLAWQ